LTQTANASKTSQVKASIDKWKQKESRSSAPRARQRLGTWLRMTLLIAVAAAVIPTVWWAAEPPLREVKALMAAGRRPRGGWTVDVVVVDVSACALLAATTVLAALVVLNVIGTSAAMRSGLIDALADRLSPHWLRQWVIGICGVALSAPGFTAVALAHSTGDHRSSGSSGVLRLDGLALPDLPSAPPARLVVVRPGDSLWSIARDQLAPHATDQALAARVLSLYGANRSTIGGDPDLIFAGQKLVAPGGAR
jgi:LysM repeat protein